MDSNIILSKKQIKLLKKRTLYAYHNLGKRTWSNEDIEQLFSGTGIPKEIIEEELSKIASTYQDLEKNLGIERHKISPKRLESQVAKEIMKEDLKKLGEAVLKVGEVTLKTITYPTLGVNFALPTMIRKGYDFKEKTEKESGIGMGGGFSILGFIVEGLGAYIPLGIITPQTAGKIALIQVGTNLASGLYEWGRSVRKRAIGKTHNY